MKFTQNLKAIIGSKKALKCLTVFCALILGTFAIFHAPKNLSSATINDDCASLADGITAEPGSNCLFSAMTKDGSKVLPLCREISSTTYTINSNNILLSGVRRHTCSNLSDLPLCSIFKDTSNNLITSVEPKAGKNCAPLCDSSFNGTGTRGVDYAIHNRDCVRFCDAMEAGTESANPSINCVDRKCHQLPNGTVPVPDNNCSLLQCNLLTPQELANVSKKIYDDTVAGRAVGKYCEGVTDIYNTPLKCYKFNKDQLDYVAKPHMCLMHNCPPPCVNYASNVDVDGDGVINQYDHDETLNISDRNRDGVADCDLTNPPADSYVKKYNTTINSEYNLNSTAYCLPVYCRPVVKKQYRCVNSGGDVSGNNNNDIYRNNNCDSSGDGATCVSNLCYKTIDCNLTENNDKAECIIPDDGSIGSTEDTVNSWFYRPRPLHKATRVTGSVRLIEDMERKLCYTQNQMKSRRDNFDNGEQFDNGRGPTSEDGKWGLDMTIKVNLGPLLGTITIPIGWFHSTLLPDETRSPKACGVAEVNTRGTGYIYLCYGDGNPNSGQLYAKVADYTAFHKGYVQTTFSEGEAIHKLKVCLRFRNSVRPDDGTSETCGSRQCGISYAYGAGTTQNCGLDRCEEFEIKDSNPDECKMETSISTGDPKKGCMKTFDTYLRLRVQKYGTRKICSFLDVKGQTAYDNGGPISNLFIKGTEKFSDGACVLGAKSSSGNCSGYSSYEEEASAEIWRTIKFGSSGNIPYIKNNQVDSNGNPLSGGIRGYYDLDGQFFAEQECIYAPLRVAPPRIYNLATINNSTRLFTPPVYILNAMTKAGSGLISPRGFGESFGTTDFSYPSIQVNFGNTTSEISLDAGETGYEENKTVINLTTTVGQNPYNVNVFVRKEFNESSKKPTFCLYRQVIDINNVEIRPERIGCVDRKLPEIYNSTTQQKAVIYLDPSSTFNSSRIAIKFMAGFGADNIDSNCLAGSDDICSPELKFENPNSSIPNCNSAIVDPTDPTTISPEMYNLCAKREECSQLNVECMQNEIDLQAAKIAGNSTDSFLSTRNRCNNFLLPLCNAKKGIVGLGGTITDQNPNGESVSPTAYGWFNEICFISGDKTDAFNSNLKQVLAYKTSPSGVKGKCITTESPAQCPNGGKAPNCNCVIANDDAVVDPDKEIRIQTNREAGLCVDMPLPQTCPAIDYNPLSTLPSDPEYVYSSLNFNSYGATQNNISNVVHISHQTRKNATANGNAEFPIAILGSINISGSCNGFWKNSVSPTTGISTAPTRTCLNNNGNAAWDSLINNPCVRYSCEAKNTTGAETEIIGANYQGGYASTETGDNKGSADGFATWPTLTKTTDFLESASATGCIPGFKKSGSSVTTSGSPIRTYETQITGYSGGTTPTRSCNQVGAWQSPSNICQRITCSAINPPANPTTSGDWIKWYDAGGATFPQTNASRNTTTGIVATGTCNTSLGFYNLGDPPTRRCDYLGNWGPVVNPCTTKCDPITTPNAPGSNNGNATWAEAIIPNGQVETAGTLIQCLAGHVPYPYPPLKDKYGTAYNLALGSVTNYSISGVTPVSGSANYTTSIPLDISTDNRSAGNPIKYCRAVSHDGVVVNNWAAANSSCIAGCPGYLDDPRVGVGVTQHPVRNGKVTIKWPGADFGTWYYISSSDTAGNPDLNTAEFFGQTAADFFDGRTNNSYLLARFCGDGNNGSIKGKWNDPVPQCVTNGGIITQNNVSSNATYNTSSSRSGVPGDPSKTVNINDTASSTSCRTDGSYYPLGSNSTTPVAISSYQCVYKSGSSNIDEVYFNKISGSSCQVYCRPPSNGALFNNSKYTGSPAAPNYTQVGGTLQLSGCQDGYGTANDNNNNTADSSCGIVNNDRGAKPIVTCQDNGTFGNVQNNCTICSNCTGASGDEEYKNTCKRTNCSGDDDQVFTINDTGRNGCGNSGDKVTQLNFNNCNHNSICSTPWVNGSKCDQGRLTYKCVDGKILLTTYGIRLGSPEDLIEIQ
jgi:hypothetical protein